MKNVVHVGIWLFAFSFACGSLAGEVLRGTDTGRILGLRGMLWSPPSAARSVGLHSTPALPDYSEWAKLAVDSLRDEYGIGADDSFFVERVQEDRFGNHHVRLAQAYQSVPVWGHQLIVHFRPDRSVYGVNGRFLSGLHIGVQPTVPPPDGASLVIWHPGGTRFSVTEARLAWMALVANERIFTDACIGTELQRITELWRNDADEAESSADKWFEQAGRYARTNDFPSDVTVQLTGTLPWQQGGGEVTIEGRIDQEGYTYMVGTNRYGVEFGVLNGNATPKDDPDFGKWVRNDTTVWSGEKYVDAVAAGHGILTVLNYYQERFGRSSYDDRGGRIGAFVNVHESNDPDEIAEGFENAFWISDDSEPSGRTPGCFYFGYCTKRDAQGRLLKNEISLDTVAHELTHGVTHNSAKLIYQGESGALNESFSDVMAIGCEFATYPDGRDLYPEWEPSRADWLFDEDSGNPLRDFKNPHRMYNPSRYLGKHWANHLSSEDEGGVHYNGMVQSYFFYLLSEGGTGVNDGISYSVRGIGVAKAAEIAYQALTAYCHPSTGYYDDEIRQAWLSAARDLIAGRPDVFTQEDLTSVNQAWDAVLSRPDQVDGVREKTFTAQITASCAGREEERFDVAIQVGATNRSGVAKATLFFTGESGKTARYAVMIRVPDGEVSVKNGYGPLSLTVGRAAVSFVWNGVAATAECVAPEWKNPLVDDWTVGLSVSVPLAPYCTVATNDSVRYSARGLPSGVKIHPKTGMLYGVPTKAGEGTFQVLAKSTKGMGSDSITVYYCVDKLPNWVSGTFYGSFTNFGENTMAMIRVSKTGRISGRIRLVDSKKNLILNERCLTLITSDEAVKFVLHLKNGVTMPLYIQDASSVFGVELGEMVEREADDIPGKMWFLRQDPWRTTAKGALPPCSAMLTADGTSLSIRWNHVGSCVLSGTLNGKAVRGVTKLVPYSFDQESKVSVFADLPLGGYSKWIFTYNQDDLKEAIEVYYE